MWSNCMCIFMPDHTYICNNICVLVHILCICIQACMHTYIHNILLLCTYMYVCMYVCTYVCMYVYAVCTYTYIHTWLHTYMHIYVHTLCVCIHTHTSFVGMCCMCTCVFRLGLRLMCSKFNLLFFPALPKKITHYSYFMLLSLPIIS